MHKNQLNINEFSLRLKQLMEENNETIYTLSSVVNLSPSTICRYTKGSMSPKIPTIEMLSQYFCVNPSWLMGISDQRNSINEISSEQIDKENALLYKKLNLTSKNKLFHFMKKLICLQSKRNSWNKCFSCFCTEN